MLTPLIDVESANDLGLRIGAGLFIYLNAGLTIYFLYIISAAFWKSFIKIFVLIQYLNLFWH